MHASSIHAKADVFHAVQRIIGAPANAIFGI